MTSEIISISPQSDGRAYVTERHTDQFGATHAIEYMAETETDRDALLAEHAAQLADQLRQSELDSWLATVRDGQPIPVDGCKYVTRNEAFAYCFRELAFDPDVSAQISTIRDSAGKLNQANAILASVTPLEAD